MKTILLRRIGHKPQVSESKLKDLTFLSAKSGRQRARFNTFLLLTLMSSLFVGCEGGLFPNLSPKRVLSKTEIENASKTFCPEGTSLKEVSDLKNDALVEFQEIRVRNSLFYFDKGDFKCALENSYVERPFYPLPPFYDFHTITEITFSDHCLLNGTLFKVAQYDHYDSVINTFRLEPFLENETSKKASVHVQTWDEKTLRSLNEVSGMRILSCETP